MPDLHGALERPGSNRLSERAPRMLSAGPARAQCAEKARNSQRRQETAKPRAATRCESANGLEQPPTEESTKVTEQPSELRAPHHESNQAMREHHRSRAAMYGEITIVPEQPSNGRAPNAQSSQTPGEHHWSRAAKQKERTIRREQPKPERAPGCQSSQPSCRAPFERSSHFESTMPSRAARGLESTTQAEQPYDWRAPSCQSSLYKPSSHRTTKESTTPEQPSQQPCDYESTTIP